MRMPYDRDQTTQRVQRALAIPLGDGRVLTPGNTITSAGDAARSADTRARDAGFDAQTMMQRIAGPSPQLGGYEGDAARRAETARLDPASNPNLRPVASNPQSEFVRQQLLAMGGAVEGRVYTPETLARATDAQVAGELAAVKPRNELIDSFLRREQTRAEMRAPVPGFDSYESAAASLPAGVEGDFVQDMKTGRWRVGSAKPAQTPGGYATAEEARSSIPEGSKGQVTQNAAGRWIVQYQVGNDRDTGPQSSLAKKQADLARAIAEGRTADANALRADIEGDINPIGRPMNVNEWMQAKVGDKNGVFGSSYGEYRLNWSKIAKGEPIGPPKVEEPKRPPFSIFKPKTWGGGNAAPTMTDYTQSGAPTVPVRSSSPAATPPASAAPVAVKTKAERDALPVGTRYIGPDGQIWTRTEPKKQQ